ncbi:MAG TPA: hypothetical protein VGX95_09350 [Xanthobacteraceae bacterium]|jgi:hypothetical protein|nr:hypothetical protein [Xanthobacteraceae bacterium]
MNPYRLPVCGIDVMLRQPAGREDLVLLEAPTAGVSAAVALLGAIARGSDGRALDWAALPASDVDAAILRVRQMTLGDAVRADARCPAQACGKTIEIAFTIGDFLTHHAPRRPRLVEPVGAQEGWYRLVDTPVTFRIPTGGDLMAQAGVSQAARELIRRCVRPHDLRGPLLARVERALEAMAPNLTSDLRARCPECGAAVALHFDAREFALRELHAQAAFIYEDMHLLARQYHWSESEILALPRDRRLQYVEMLRHHGEP